MIGILHIGNGHGGIGDPEVDNCIHGHCHTVSCQDLKVHRLVWDNCESNYGSPKQTP